MAEPERLSDDEVVVRWINRSDPSRFQPPDRISSGNFKERSGETGLSVFQLTRTSFAAMLEHETRGNPDDYLFVETTVGAIRTLTSAAGLPLDLNVIPDEDGGRKPGHALIVGKITQSASKALSRLFKPLEIGS